MASVKSNEGKSKAKAAAKVDLSEVKEEEPAETKSADLVVIGMKKGKNKKNATIATSEVDAQQESVKDDDQEASGAAPLSDRKSARKKKGKKQRAGKKKG